MSSHASHLLALAQQKLQETHVPFELRVAYYLRLSCALLQDSAITYTKLIHELFDYDRQWISTCEVSSSGLLTSSDRTIDMMLSVVTDLHRSESVLEQLPVMEAIAA